MALCFDSQNNRYEYCPTQMSTYIAVAVIIPAAIIVVALLVYVYLRCRQRQLRREHQQTYMATIIPIYNSDQSQGSFDYPYPPNYTSMSARRFDKPPSYEQTVQETSETNTDGTHLVVEDSSAILPIATITTLSEESSPSPRHHF